jgi:hypothetical protein
VVVSFSDGYTPSWGAVIENPADRLPRTTLFLLKYLECAPSDPDLKAKIADNGICAIENGSLGSSEE